jgi:hypothetical protein
MNTYLVFVTSLNGLIFYGEFLAVWAIFNEDLSPASLFCFLSKGEDGID